MNQLQHDYYLSRAVARSEMAAALAEEQNEELVARIAELEEENARLKEELRANGL